MQTLIMILAAAIVALVTFMKGLYLYLISNDMKRKNKKSKKIEKESIKMKLKAKECFFFFLLAAIYLISRLFTV